LTTDNFLLKLKVVKEHVDTDVLLVLYQYTVDRELSEKLRKSHRLVHCDIISTHVDHITSYWL